PIRIPLQRKYQPFSGPRRVGVYPNFEIDISELDGFYFGEESPFQENDRPVETGIYIPDDVERVAEGGSAIYLRQRGYGRLLRGMMGLELNLEGPDGGDLQRLHLLDTTPSLDPFLLKDAFDRSKFTYTGSIFDLSAEEEFEIKKIIIERTKKIVGFALGGNETSDSKKDERSSKRFVDAIWDPSLPEARVFVEAFRIEADEVDKVFSGWKGVSYYQYSFSSNINGIRELSAWFRSNQSRPLDAAANASYMENLEMHKRQVFGKYERLLKNTIGVFREYDAAYTTFYNDRDPLPLREFLRTAQQRYWVLGFACSALFHCVHILERERSQARGGRFTFDQISEILTRMMTTMGSEVRTDLPG
ncbi:MAG: hypothetical protein O3C34_21495, partial [Proteobacteria bacterium]|nr:hypothetical protein [Pseudomonadota bacterium]